MNTAIKEKTAELDPEKVLVCAATMGRMLERGSDTILEWRRIGLIRGYKIGRVVMFDPLEVVEDLKTLGIEGKAEVKNGAKGKGKGK